MEPQVSAELPARCQVAGDVLVHHHPGAAQHLRPRHRALQPARVARALPGDRKHVLRRPLHRRDAAQDVRPGLSGDNAHLITLLSSIIIILIFDLTLPQQGKLREIVDVMKS